MFLIKFPFGTQSVEVDLHLPIDLSLPMHSGAQNPNAFHIPQPRFEPIQVGSFVGSVAKGSGANCENLQLNAHGNGTHTECVGHITPERVSINSCLKQFHFLAQLISIPSVRTENGDEWLPAEGIEAQLLPGIDALIVRSLPNTEEKRLKNYSGQNPCYFDPKLTQLLAEKGIMHLLTDLPSVDREEDGGAMAAHKAFWQYPHQTRFSATISEMVFIPGEVKDGLYFLNMQIASLETDASPSKPVIYKLIV